MTTMQLNPAAAPAERNPADLVTAAAGSDAQAWEAIVAQYSRMVGSIARGCGLSDADVADVRQTVWLRLLEHVGRLRNPERVGSWLATTTRNEAMRLARQRRLTRPVEGLEALAAPAEPTDWVSRVETEERRTQVRALVATLPVRQQELLEQLMADPQPSYVEIATSLGIPVGSIGPTRQRSLRTLRAKCIAAHL